MDEGQHSLCPLYEKATEFLGTRWNLMIIKQLLSGPQRFGEIQTALPISGRLLSERLKYMEKEDLVTRQIFPEVPVRVEYTLTEKGRALAPIMMEIGKWSQDWLKE